jgi:hypothetical protein
MTRPRRPRPALASVCLLVLGFPALSSALPAVAQSTPPAALCPILPADDIWNTPVDTLPVDPSSDTYIATIGADGDLRPDFAAGLWEGAPIGIPFVEVPADQARVPVSFLYADESDPGPYAIPVDAPIEGGPDGDGDRHVLALDQTACTLYELFNAFPQDDGSWTADSGAVFDLRTSDLRPDGWTSADAAGLPILPGLVRHNEVAAGEIRHALRFTVPDTRREYVWPARHFASDSDDPALPPMGARFRLKADVDISGFSPDAQVILRALQTYGMILADNGSPWFLSGAPHERWDDEVLSELRQVHGSDFQAVDVSSLMVSADSGQASAVASPKAGATDSPALEADLYVSASNTTRDEDGSIGAPYSTIGAALDVATDGQVIAVAAGDYPGNIRIEGHTVTLNGGYTDDFRSRDPAASVTTIQGDGTDSVVSLIEAGASIVDGFTITGGANSSVPEYGEVGGGLYVSGGSPTISNNVIEGNDARPPMPGGSDPLGGGIYAENANISILDNIVRANTAGRGGGLAIIGGDVTISGNTVADNIGVSDHGGGLYIASPRAEISDNRISGNQIGRELGYGWGGGIIVFGEGSSAILSHNEVTANYAPSVGGGVFIDDGAIAILDHELIHDNICPDGGTTGGVGIYVDGYDTTVGSKVTIVGSTVAGHDCETQGGNGLYVEAQSEVTIRDSIFWGNSGDDFIVDDTSSINAAYTLSQEPLAGEGNLSADPLFADPIAQDYHLRSTAGRWDPAASGGAGVGTGAWVIDDVSSPAIDAADQASTWLLEPDPNGGRANLGADGNTPGASKTSR